MSIIHDDEVARQAARVRWKARELDRELLGIPVPPVVLEAARPALLDEVPRGALAVGRVARAVGFMVASTYARALVLADVRCPGGLAVLTASERGEQWCCPSCGSPGAVTGAGRTRAHGARGDDGRVCTERVTMETLALRMNTPDWSRRCVAVWANGRFDCAVIMRPMLRRVGCTQLTEWLSEK